MGKKHAMKSSRGLVGGISLTEKFTFNPKEGIDNPVMVITDDADSVWTPIPRMCVLKRDDEELYGFHLRVERGRQGHIIRNVASGGVAERGGLREGDRLLEVNNCYVDDVPHAEVARKIKICGHQLCLLVLDGEDYEQVESRGLDLKGLARAHKDDNCKPPRLCHITRDPDSGLGINFTPLEGQRGRFSVNLVTGGAAEKAGVCKGDRLVWINGAVVSNLIHSALSKMMKKCGDHITILVIDGESEKRYLQRRLPILPSMAIPHKLPHTARKLHLISAAEGFGFLLRLEKVPSGRTYHILREMTRGSPAEMAGMRDGELLLEVNGESVESLKHEEVVDRVRLSGQELYLTTITPQGLEFYTQLGLSPLLFCEDDAAGKEKENIVPTSAEENSPPKEMDVSSNLGLCSLQKGTLISQVASKDSGQSAGPTVGDLVMNVNGQNVKEKSLEDVTMLVEEGEQFLSLLVVDKTSYNKTETPPKDVTHTEETKMQEEENNEISAL